jgi:type III secretion system FlhB-like substrate exporter
MACEAPEGVTVVSKHVAVVKDHTLERVLKLCVVLVSQMNTIIHILIQLNLKIAEKHKFYRLVAEIFSS